MKYQTSSAEQTKSLAAEFSAQLVPGDVLCMHGELGAGKTAFVQGLAEGLGIQEPITSPTFTIVNEYRGRIPLYHFDVYRLNDSDELYEIGYEEYVNGDGICVIEWPQIIADAIPLAHYDVTITKDLSIDDDYREIEITNTEKGADLHENTGGRHNF